MGQPLLRSVLAASVIAAVSASAHASDWLQFGGDEAHSSFNRQENGYAAPSNNTLELAGIALAHRTDSAPTYASAVATSSGTKNLLLINALDGTLSAIDAATGNVVWSKQPTPAPGTNGILAQGGITGSPAIDAAKQFVYAYGLDGNVHKYQLANGTEVLTNNTSTGKTNGWPEISTLKPESEKGASGIAINATASGTFAYSVTNGYDGDGGDYQGHVTAINLSTNTQKVFNVECSDQAIHFTSSSDCSSVQNGIWGRPGAIYDPGTGLIFVATANGPFNANTGGHNWGDSVLALNPDGSGSGSGKPVDSYTPSSFANLQTTDADLGSTSPALLPAPAGSNVAHLALQGGKDGCVRLINLGNLSGQGQPGKVGGELQAQPLPNVTDHCADGGNLSTFKTQPAVWVNPSDGSTWAFIGHNAGFAAYQVTLSGGTPSLTMRWNNNKRGSSPVVAAGVVYYVSDGNSQPDNSGSKTVYALDALTGNQLWSYSSSSDANFKGGVHWQSPIVANGRLYLIDNASHLYAFKFDGVFRGKFD